LWYFQNLINRINNIFEAQEIILDQAKQNFQSEVDITIDKKLEIMYFERII